MSDSDLIEITADEAVVAIERCAFTTDEGRSIVHCFAGSIGADWDTADAVDAARRADRLAWVRFIFARGLCLGMEVDGRVRIFDGVTPEPEAVAG